MSRLKWDRVRAISSIERAETAQSLLADLKLYRHGGDCPNCGKATVERAGPYSSFFGCVAYPRCKGIWKPIRA